MSESATFRFETDRTFSVMLYWHSHGLLLLRSPKSNDHDTQIDILFQDVRWMTIPSWIEGMLIESISKNDISHQLTERIKEEIEFMSVFQLVSQGISNFIVCSPNIQFSEESESWKDNSPLLPDFDFKSFHP